MQLASHVRALLVVALCASALPAVAQINPGFDPSTPIRVVYRVELTPPFSAFIAGFTARGVDRDLISLTSGHPCINWIPLQGPAWVSMTADREQAVRFARRYLENTPGSGPHRPVYLYAIRADAEFLSVPGAFYSAIDAGREARAGYTPEHANALEYLLYTRPILGEQAVVATHVRPRNIANAAALWLQNGEVFEDGVGITNSGYVHDPSTAAINVVPDSGLPTLLPQLSILSSEVRATGTCAMSCDRAKSASSFSLPDDTDYAAQCSQSDAIAPLLLDIIND
ncbi:hypothetical protein [Noviluteimonas gilva]|uniref:Uncharacterized protein n=1 Tax=Noviluteimonas gilva TaxID=2682097 RepID=A0A7C9HYF7_9GAMM|nr:hypothetical protein [Lysobacter gilvus]MUV14054.1 hypothetical protein [Lysobacter gilvus]